MRNLGRLAHIPEKWIPVFRRGYATTQESRAHLKCIPMGCALVLTVLAFVGGAYAPAQAQEFPYDRDLVLDARAMLGSKRIPVIAVSPDGQAQIDLWCKRGTGQVAIAGDAITITIGTMRDEPGHPRCSYAQATASRCTSNALGDGAALSRRDELTAAGWSHR